MKKKNGTMVNMKLSAETVALLRDYQHALKLPSRTAAVEHAIQSASRAMKATK